MKRSRLCAILLLLVAGCDGKSDDFPFSIYATPPRLHAPGDVQFSLLRDDGGDVEGCTGKWNFGDGVSMQGDYETTHRYRTAGTYTVSVELECGEEKGNATFDLEVFGTVDLSVSSIESRPLDVSTDGQLTVSMQVSNGAGNPLMVPTTIDVYLSPTPTETAYRDSGAMRIYRHTLPSLGAAGTEKAVERLEFSVPLDATVRTGAYYVSAVVNADQTLGESTYDNNASYSPQPITVRNQSTDGADFYAKRLQISPNSTSILSSATAQFDIVNLGSTTAEEYTYEIWMGAKDNATDMAGAVKVHESTIAGGISGEEQTFRNVAISIAPTVTEEGLYYFWLLLDTKDRIVERDESNNSVRSTGPIRVTSEAMLDADITVESVEFVPSGTTMGGTFTATLRLYNQGAQPTGSFVCTVFLSSDMALDIAKDHVVGAINVANLQPLGNLEQHAIMSVDTSVAPGNYWVYAFCDSSGVVTEANEDNNIQRSASQITISGSSNVDLVPSHPQLETEGSIADGNVLNMSIPVCNKGTTASGPFYVSAYRKNTWTSEEKEYARVLVEGLEAGACQTVFFTNEAHCDFWNPVYDFRFVVDSTKIVAESNENNNEAPSELTVIILGEDCLCVADARETNNATAQATSIRNLDEDLTLCATDTDVFTVPLQKGESFEATLTHDHAREPLQMKLYRGADLVHTVSGSDSLHVSDFLVTDADESPIYLFVSAVEPNGANHYHLRVDTYGTADGVDLAVSNLDIPGGGLNASDTRSVTLKLSNNGTQPSPDFYLGYYVSETTEIDDSSWLLARQHVEGLAARTSVLQGVSLKLPADTSGGRYYLIAKADTENAVTDARPSNNTTHSAQWDFQRTCWDVLDPNESLETARLLTLTDGKYTRDALAVCQDNPDFYVFHVDDASTVDISVTGLGVGDFDIALLDQNGNEIASSRTGSSTETIHRDIVVGDQWLYLQVYLLDNNYNARNLNYGMEIRVSEAPTWYACNAAFEPNNYPTSAYALLDAMHSGKTAEICPSDDEDYYAIPLAEGDRLQMHFETEEGNLRAALYYGIEFEFLQMLTNLRTQSIDYTATQDGIHLLRVFTNVPNAPKMAYRLVNDAAAGPDVAVSGLTLPASTAQAGDIMTVSCTVSNAGTADADVETSILLETPTNTHTLWHQTQSIAAGASVPIRQKVALPSLFTGEATLTVLASAPGDANPDNDRASAPLTIVAACRNDALEPNDNILLASDLAATHAAICPDDLDWYVVRDSDLTRIAIQAPYIKGDLDLYAYDASGNEVARSATALDEESVPADGVSYILVKGARSDVANGYDIVLE